MAITLTPTPSSTVTSQRPGTCRRVVRRKCPKDRPGHGLWVCGLSSRAAWTTRRVADIPTSAAATKDIRSIGRWAKSRLGANNAITSGAGPGAISCRNPGARSSRYAGATSSQSANAAAQISCVPVTDARRRRGSEQRSPASCSASSSYSEYLRRSTQSAMRLHWPGSRHIPTQKNPRFRQTQSDRTGDCRRVESFYAL